MARIVKQANERRLEIVQAARHLFEAKDFERATMQDIMDSLKIAKGTIYHYFKSKEELLEAVIEDIVRENLNQMQTFIKKTKGNALKKIQVAIEAGNIADREKPILDQLHKKGNAAMHTRVLAATLLKQAPLYAELIEQGCSEGIFQTEAPLECSEFILSAVQFLTDPGIYSWTEEDLMRRVKAFPKLIEQLLKAPPGSFHFLVKLL